jgi:hypothetical protein
VFFQGRNAGFDAAVANMHALGRLRWIRDEHFYLVLGLAAKRTSEDFILAALEKHKSSMAGQCRKSRFAKVQSALLVWRRF